jgi:hypothetical protein
MSTTACQVSSAAVALQKKSSKKIFLKKIKILK